MPVVEQSGVNIRVVQREEAAPHTDERVATGMAWAVLDALGVRGKAGVSIEALEDGAVGLLRGDPLKVSRVLDRSHDIEEPSLPFMQDGARDAVLEKLTVARGKAAGVRRLLDEGGHVVAGGALGALGQAKSPPLCMYGEGHLDVLETAVRGKAVAIVGTRRPTSRGRQRAFDFAYAVAKAGAVVVSGGALGIDLAAHEGALEAGGQTLAILGESVAPSPTATRASGRPGRVAAIFERYAPEQSLSLTSSGPWKKTGRTSFVSRNRLVAALADVVILVEGAERSGALYTVDYANQLRREVYAVPGDPADELAQAANAVIARGEAQVLLDIDTMLQRHVPHLGWAPPTRAGATQTSMPTPSRPSPPPPSAAEQEVLDGLRTLGGRALLDDLADKLQLNTSDLLERALTLELDGHLLRQGAFLCLPHAI